MELFTQLFAKALEGQKIEEIVCTYEQLGIHCGVRHDFG